MKKRNKLIVTLGCLLMATLSAGAMVQFNKAYADDGVFTLDDVAYTMIKGAGIYKNSEVERLGIRFSAGMSTDDYNELKDNTGENKAYKSITYGVVIAPNSYGEINEQNLFGIGGAKIYDWATWDGENWVYEGDGTYTRVINIESDDLKWNDDENAYCSYGAITTLQPENLLKEFNATGYIKAVDQDGNVEYKFAATGDTVRTPAYVAQQRQQDIKEEIAALDATEDAAQIAGLEAESELLGEKYLTADVTSQNAMYTVEHYYKKPDGDGYFLYDTETKTGAINSAISTNGYASEIEGVTFDRADADAVVYAQDKSVVKAYYDVAYGADADNQEKVFNIGETADYTVDNEIQAVYTADMEKISDNGEIENSVIVAMGKGEHDLYVLTEDGFAKYSAIMATHVIATADEFVTFFNSYTGGSSSNGTANWYAVLTDDVDLNDTTKTFTEKGTADYYAGTFNGLGHVVRGYTGKGQGLFGYTPSSVVIENFALIESNAGANYLISGYMTGRMNNVYVEATANTNDNSRYIVNIASQNDIGKMYNCIINVTGGTATHILKSTTSSVSSLTKNNYFIAETDTVTSIDLNDKITGTLYNSREQFMLESDCVENISNSQNGWSKYWKNTAFGLYFGNALVAQNPDIEVDETKETAYLNVVEVGTTGAVSGTKTHEINLKEMLNGQTPETVLIDGVEVTATDAIALSSADYAYGTEHSILFGAGETVIEQPFMFATHVISNEDEFVTFIDSYENGGWTTANGTETWYAVLTKDLDMTGKTITKQKTTSDYWHGTFDGLGHYVSNITFASSGGTTSETMGLFGYTMKGSVIKNLALTNVVSTDRYILSGLVSGTVENVYMQGTYKVSGQSRGPIKVDGNNAKLNNVVFDLNTSTPAILTEDVSTASNRIGANTYVVGADAFAGTFGWNWETNKTYVGTAVERENALHANVAALLGNTAFITDISAGATNGWSEYWNLTGDATNGYTLTFGSVTVGTTVTAG